MAGQVGGYARPRPVLHLRHEPHPHGFSDTCGRRHRDSPQTLPIAGRQDDVDMIGQPAIGLGFSIRLGDGLCQQLGSACSHHRGKTSTSAGCHVG